MANNDYIQANKRWLAEKAKEEGVNALPKGILRDRTAWHIMLAV